MVKTEGDMNYMPVDEEIHFVLPVGKRFQVGEALHLVDKVMIIDNETRWDAIVTLKFVEPK